MAIFVLIHGGGSSAWDWHRVEPLLRSMGHGVIAVDLPIEDASAGLEDYVLTVADAVGNARDLIVVGHSLGGFTAPLVCERLHANGLVYVAGMIPLPNETFSDWWTNTGHDREVVDDDPEVSFFNGVPDYLAREARERARDQQGAWLSQPWPADRHPAVPARAVLCREDRFFPAPFMRRQVRRRLGTEPVEVPGGHYALLSHPQEIAVALDGFAQDLGMPGCREADC